MRVDDDDGGGVDLALLSFVAITIPVEDESVFRGLLKVDAFRADLSAMAAGDTA